MRVGTTTHGIRLEAKIVNNGKQRFDDRSFGVSGIIRIAGRRKDGQGQT